MLILGIETSCDETACAIVDDKRKIHSNIVISQLKQHDKYGGVIPEVAARAHLELLETVITEALKQADLSLNDMDAIAATCGPGLIGGVMVGATTAKAMALGLSKPFIAVNHLCAHALTARLTDDVEFPYLLLLVSGGHTQLVIVKSAMKYEVLGSTIDDAVGEAFDKVAKLLGLAYPGGPKLEKLAQNGAKDVFKFPRPLLQMTKQRVDGKGTAQQKYNFSLSGLKTAVRTAIGKLGSDINSQDKANIASSFQAAVGDIITNRCHNGLQYCTNHNIDVTSLVIAGGVGANLYLRKRLSDALSDQIDVIVPPPNLCVDNGAMVAWAGMEKYKLGLTDSLDFIPKPRWPLADI